MRQQNSESGSTLLEAVVVFPVIILGSVFLISSFVSAQKLNDDANVIAASAASEAAKMPTTAAANMRARQTVAQQAQQIKGLSCNVTSVDSRLEPGSFLTLEVVCQRSRSRIELNSNVVTVSASSLVDRFSSDG